MTTFTISIPEDLKRKIDRHPEINWAAYVRQRFAVKLRELQQKRRR